MQPRLGLGDSVDAWPHDPRSDGMAKPARTALGLPPPPLREESMHAIRSILLASAALAATCAGANEPTAAQKLGKLLGTCEIALPEDWRDAGAEDYADPAWAAWTRQTGSATPWRAEADFDGDGRADIAKVLIHRHEPGRWMMGVKFGMAPGEDCFDKRHPRRFQISDDGHGKHALAGVFALAKGSEHVACHQNGGDTPLVCRAPDDAAFAARPGAALLTFDAQPSYVAGYFWRAMRSDSTNPRGWSPAPQDDRAAFWRFDSVAIATEVDAQALLQAARASSTQAKAGDRIDAAERLAVVAEFDAAWAAFERVPRSRTVQSMKMDANAAPMVFMTIERLAPDRRRVVIGAHGSGSETVWIGERTWTRSTGGAWSETRMPAEAGFAGGIVGAADILAVRVEQRAGRKVKVLDLEQAMAGTTLRRSLAIDVERGLPLQIVDGDPGSAQAMTTDFDYDTPIAIEAP